MNTLSYLAAAVRILIVLTCGYFVHKGIISADQKEETEAAMTTIAVAAWSIYQKYQANKALQAAIAAPAGQAK